VQSPSPQVLLSGARFRALCMALAVELNEEITTLVSDVVPRDAGTYALPGSFPLHSGPRDRLICELRALPLDGLRQTSDPLEFLPALAVAVDSAMPWQPPFTVDAITADPSVQRALLPLAAAVLAAPGTAWWRTDVDTSAQWVTSPTRNGRLVPASSTGPVASVLASWSENHEREEADRSERGVTAARNVGGAWWSTPHNYGRSHGEWARPLSSTRRLSTLGALELALVEDSFGDEEARLQRLTATRPLRVFEVHAPGDWASLVTRYPRSARWARVGSWGASTGRHEQWLIPDYRKVAADYDGIHVSVQGYLATAGEVTPVPSAATVLAGWSPDETFWLTDDVILSRDVELWRSKDENLAPVWQRA